MVIVDSAVWIDLLRGRDTPHVAIFEKEAGVQEIGIPDLVLYEVLQGVRPATKFDEVKSRLLTFPMTAVGGKNVALKAVENARRLRSLGVQTKTVDCLIATFCIENGHLLLTSDADFSAYAEHLGLILLSPV
jgi:predicted nucleic acid-binding protein